jgi:hypothetical protein
MKKCPQVEILELKDKVDELQAVVKSFAAVDNARQEENAKLQAQLDAQQEQLGINKREWDILEGACDFWKQEAIDRGYEE